MPGKLPINDRHRLHLQGGWGKGVCYDETVQQRSQTMGEEARPGTGPGRGLTNGHQRSGHSYRQEKAKLLQLQMCPTALSRLMWTCCLRVSALLMPEILVSGYRLRAAVHLSKCTLSAMLAAIMWAGCVAYCCCLVPHSMRLQLVQHSWATPPVAQRLPAAASYENWCSTGGGVK